MESLLQPTSDGSVGRGLNDGEVLALSIKKPAMFRILVERWRPRLFARAARAMGNADDAEDVVQETLVRVYKYAHRYQEREEERFSAWVYAIFYNVVKTYQHRRKQRSVFVNTSQLAVNEAAEESIEFPDIANQNRFESFLDVDQVISVLGRLPRSVARLLRLHVLEGKSYDELAKTEGVSIGAIRVRLHRARQSFQDVFQSDE